MDHFLAACERAAQIGGEQLLRLRGNFQTWEKNARDFVTDADIASQQAIQEFLSRKFPDHRFLGEESTSPTNGCQDSPYCWVVDPLDGTLNYIHNLQSYSVSVALRKGDKVIAGAVYDPLLDEMFLAAESRSATLNGRPIKVSECGQLERALVAISLPSNVSSDSPELEPFLRILYNAQSVRRLGSAALNLCYVACGRLDAYWAITVSQWDVAAGWLILEQGGGTMRGMGGGPFDPSLPRFAATASRQLADELEQLLA